MQMFGELTPDEWLDTMEQKLLAVNALRLLVEGPETGKPDPVMDPRTSVHNAFHTYRAAMPDNHPGAHELARLEHEFVAALCALNFDDQLRQLRLALIDMQSFHHANR